MKRILFLLASMITLTLSSCVPQPPIAVNGVVIGDYNLPEPGVSVTIDGVSTTTDANGNFSFTDVYRPYEATVVATKGDTTYTVTFELLTRPDPTLQVRVDPFTDPRTAYSATIAGTLSEADSFVDAGNPRRGEVLFESADGSGQGSVGNLSADYAIPSADPVKWYGNTSTSGTLHALQWEETAAEPLDFTGYGMLANVNLSNGAGLGAQNISLDPAAVSNLSFSGDFTMPTTFTSNLIGLAVELGNYDLLFNTDLVTSGSSTFSYVTPDISSSTLKLTALTGGGGESAWKFVSGIPADASGYSFKVPTAASLSAPADGASNLSAGTIFSWSSSMSNAVHDITFTNAADDYVYRIVTPNRSVAMPNLPTGTGFNWEVTSVGPFASIDSAAGAAGYMGFVYFATDGEITDSVTRTFTTP